MPPVKVVDTRRPAKITSPKPGVRVYDFGRHTAGWARISTEGAAGTTVTLRFGEQLDGDGLVVGSSLGSHVDMYTLSGDGTEVWEPSFTRHGFRYVQIEQAGENLVSFPQGLPHASATVGTPHGGIRSSWRREGRGVTLRVDIPAGTPTEVRVPRSDGGYDVHRVSSGSTYSAARDLSAGWSCGRRVPG